MTLEDVEGWAAGQLKNRSHQGVGTENDCRKKGKNIDICMLHKLIVCSGELRHLGKFRFALRFSRERCEAMGTDKCTPQYGLRDSTTH